MTDEKKEMENVLDRLVDVTEEEMMKVQPNIDTLREQRKALDTQINNVWHTAFEKAVERVKAEKAEGIVSADVPSKRTVKHKSVD